MITTLDRPICRPSGTTLSIGTVGPVVMELSKLDAWLRDEVVVDLSAVSFSNPSGLLALATSTAKAVQGGTRVRVVCPTCPGCCGYLATSGLLQHWAGLGVILDGSGERETRSPSTALSLLALTAFETDGDAGDIRTRVSGVVQRLLGTGSAEWLGRCQAFSSSVHEMSTNVVRHAPGATGYVLAQKYRNRYNGHWYVEFAVGDSGPGIPAVLRPKQLSLAGAADAEVLDQMLRERLSSGAGGGYGYYAIREFTSRHGGSFDLRSGGASLAIGRGKSTWTTESLGWTWPGTVVSGSVTCPR